MSLEFTKNEMTTSLKNEIKDLSRIAPEKNNFFASQETTLPIRWDEFQHSSIVERLWQNDVSPRKWDNANVDERVHILSDAKDIFCQELGVSQSLRKSIIVENGSFDNLQISKNATMNIISFDEDFILLSGIEDALNVTLKKIMSIAEIDETIAELYVDHLNENYNSKVESQLFDVGAASKDIQKKISKAQSNLNYHQNRLQKCMNDKSKGWIGVDPAISDHKFGMWSAQNELSSLQRDLKKALAAEEKKNKK